MVEIALYCPRCADRVQIRALSLDFEEIVACPSCSHQAKAASLLTGEGKTLLDYLALQSLKAFEKDSTGG
jgi:hypothetical protein